MSGNYYQGCNFFSWIQPPLAWSLSTIISSFHQRFLRLQNLFYDWITYSLQFFSWQNILTNAAILPRVSSHTGATVIIHAIHTSGSILAWSICTVIYILDKRFLEFNFGAIILNCLFSNKFEIFNIFLPMLQFFPLNPATQVQLYSFTPSLHVAPFWHGPSAQLSISWIDF